MQQIKTLPIPEFAGCSTDFKPLDVPEGSIFNELDTNITYRREKNGWEVFKRPVTSVNGFTGDVVISVPTPAKFYLGVLEGEEQYRAFKDAECTTLATADELNAAMPNAIFDLETCFCFPLYFSYFEGVATIYFRIGDSDIEVTTATE